MAAEYKTKITIEYEYGHFEWCGNSTTSKHPYYNLTVKNTRSLKKKTMVMLTIELNDALLNDITGILCLNCKGHDIQHSVGKIQKTNKFFFSIDDEFLNTYISIQYIIFDDNSSGFYKKKIIIYNEDFFVRKNEILGSNECSICLQKVCDDKYVSRCKHMFHLNCIYEVSKTSNTVEYVENNHECCKYCDHYDKITYFKCPVCLNEYDYLTTINNKN